MPIQITLTGIVNRTAALSNPTSTALQSMEVKTFVWDLVQSSLSFTVSALFPTTARWQNIKLPQRGALVHIMGEIIGKREGSGQVVVLIQGFDYISTRGTEGATQVSMGEEEQSPPQTPAKSRWAKWQSRSTAAESSKAAEKKCALDVGDDEEDLASPSKHRRRTSSDDTTIDQQPSPE